MPDGTVPTPGGWNRFALELTDLVTTVEALRQSGARFRNDIVTGVGGKQILVEDPSGNPIELFEPLLEEANSSTSTTFSNLRSCSHCSEVIAYRTASRRRHPIHGGSPHSASNVKSGRMRWFGP
jgi:hypothetical protein